MHYKSEDEARKKWNRRKERINFDRLLVKMSQRGDSGEEEIAGLLKLPYNNMICFTEDEHDDGRCVCVPELKRLNVEGGDETPFTFEKIDVNEVINNMK